MKEAQLRKQSLISKLKENIKHSSVDLDVPKQTCKQRCKSGNDIPEAIMLLGKSFCIMHTGSVVFTHNSHPEVNVNHYIHYMNDDTKMKGLVANLLDAITEQFHKLIQIPKFCDMVS